MGCSPPTNCKAYAGCEKMDEITGVVDVALPYVSAFAAACGGAVVERIWTTTVDDSADYLVGGRGAVAAHVARDSGPFTTGYNSPIQR
jgi:hypothetical protein